MCRLSTGGPCGEFRRWRQFSNERAGTMSRLASVVPRCCGNHGEGRRPSQMRADDKLSWSRNLTTKPLLNRQSCPALIAAGDNIHQQLFE